MGISGCLAFVLILTSRLNELSSLRGDLSARLVRGRQERFAAKVTWEAIQRIELSESLVEICQILEKTRREPSSAATWFRSPPRVTEAPVLESQESETPWSTGAVAELSPTVSGPTAIFRLSSGQDLLLTVSLHQSSGSPLAADIAFRFLQRLSMATAERLERLLVPGADETVADAGAAGLPVVKGAVASARNRRAGGPGSLRGLRPAVTSRAQVLPIHAPFKSPTIRALIGWFRLGPPRFPAGRAPSLARGPRNKDFERSDPSRETAIGVGA